MSASKGCFILLLGVALVSAADKCHFEELMKCGQPMEDFRKAHGQRFPTTEAQVEELCNGMQKGLDCAEDFSNKCMTPMQLQMMGYLTEGSFQVYNDFCKDKSDLQTQYIKHAPCLNEAFQSEEYKEVSSYVEAGLEDLQQKKPNERLPITCCGYQYMVDRSMKLGEEKCGKEAVDIFIKVVEMAASSIPTMMCQGFDPNAEQCTSVLPPPGAKPSGTLRNSHIAQIFTELYLTD